MSTANDERPSQFSLLLVTVVCTLSHMAEDIQDGVIGSRLRKRRKALSYTLEQVATEAGITPGYLSQLERGAASGAVSTLQKVCGVLRLSVGDLFQPESPATGNVLRYSDAARIHFGNGASKVKLSPAAFDHLEILLGNFEPGGDTGDQAYTHGESEELLLVVEGTVDVTVDGETRTLSTLDSMYYNSGQPHRISEATGTDTAKVMWAMAPPTY